LRKEPQKEKPFRAQAFLCEWAKTLAQSKEKVSLRDLRPQRPRE